MDHSITNATGTATAAHALAHGPRERRGRRRRHSLAQTFGMVSETMLLVPVLAYILEWAVFGGLVTYSYCPRCGGLFQAEDRGG